MKGSFKTVDAAQVSILDFFHLEGTEGTIIHSFCDEIYSRGLIKSYMCYMSAKSGSKGEVMRKCAKLSLITNLLRWSDDISRARLPKEQFGWFLWLTESIYPIVGDFPEMDNARSLCKEMIKALYEADREPNIF